MPPPPWLHNKITREDAEALVTEAGLDDGRFLLRTREGKKGEYVLCVVYKGKPTHHLCSKNEEGLYAVNKKTYGGHEKISALVAQLSKKTAGWPVPLDKPVHRAGAGSTAPAPAPPAATTPAATAKPAAKGGSYVHKGITRERAEELVTAAGLDDGRFLCRNGKKPGDFVLCVVYKGKPTHHLMGKGEDGGYVINKKSYGPFKKPNLLIKHLSKKGVKGWPVPLDKPVYVGGGGGDDGAAAKTAAAKAAAAKAIEEATKEKEAEKVAEAEEVSAESTESNPEPAAPETSTDPAVALPAAPETSTDPTQQLQATALAAAEAAHQDVAQKKAELEALRTQALLPSANQSFRLDGVHPGDSSSSDGPNAVTPNLARLVIKMGQRLSELEMQTQQLSQVIQSVMDHAQRIAA